MALVLILLLVFLFLFWREVLLMLLRSLYGARLAPEGPWDLKARSQSPLSFHIYLCPAPPIETLILSTNLGAHFLVHESLWADWGDLEREAFLLWAYAASVKTSPLQRIIGGAPITSLDRDVGIMRGTVSSLFSALEKTEIFRKQLKPTALGWTLTGLSFIGPSLVMSFPTVEDRIHAVASKLNDLNRV